MIDVQSSHSKSTFSIAQTGVSGLTYPWVFVNHGRTQKAMADWRLSVSIPASERGTHMSRMIEFLEDLGDTPVGLPEMGRYFGDFLQRLNAGHGQMEASFLWSHRVSAPVTGKSSWLQIPTGIRVSGSADQFRTRLRVSVPVTSLCPCSKAISDYGAHNQRSEIQVALISSGAPNTDLDGLIGLLSVQGSAPIYPLLKRDDEKFVTEQAFDNPGFVEDIARNVAAALENHPSGERINIKVKNFESIHAHDCFAALTLRR